VKDHPEYDFYFFFDRNFDSVFVDFENVTGVVLHPQARHPILYKIWFEWSVKRALKRLNIDLFWSPDGILSMGSNVPQLVTIHDLNFEHYPEDLPKKDLRYYLKNFPKFARKASHIFTVSEFSKSDIVKQYGIDEEKISITYNAADQKFKPSGGERKDSQYFVYVGALHKRKNIDRMLLAFDQWKQQNSNNVQLVIVGEKLFRSQSGESVYDGLVHKDDVVFTGRVSDADLVKHIASSKGLVYVSYFEGFGIPILEAMSCGIPVLTSNVTSMPEVGGDLAIYCDPFDVISITKGLARLNDWQGNKHELVERASSFRWDNSAKIISSRMKDILN